LTPSFERTPSPSNTNYYWNKLEALRIISISLGLKSVRVLTDKKTDEQTDERNYDSLNKLYSITCYRA